MRGMSRILVAYYSRSGTTRRLAEQLAHALDADIEAIEDPTDRTGVLGYLRSAFQGLRRTRVDVRPALLEPHAYDLVLVGTPIWDDTVSVPVRSYLHLYQGQFPETAFFCTCGSSRGDRAFAEMARIAGRTPLATLRVREREIDRDQDLLAKFLGQLAPFLPAVQGIAVGASAHATRPRA